MDEKEIDIELKRLQLVKARLELEDDLKRRQRLSSAKNLASDTLGKAATVGRESVRRGQPLLKYVAWGSLMLVVGFIALLVFAQWDTNRRNAEYLAQRLANCPLATAKKQYCTQTRSGGLLDCMNELDEETWCRAQGR